MVNRGGNACDNTVCNSRSAFLSIVASRGLRKSAFNVQQLLLYAVKSESGPAWRLVMSHQLPFKGARGCPRGSSYIKVGLGTHHL